MSDQFDPELGELGCARAAGCIMDARNLAECVMDLATDARRRWPASGAMTMALEEPLEQCS